MRSGRPEEGEFATYAAEDIAYVAGDDAVATLVAVAAETSELFGSVTDEQMAPYAPGKWTLKELLGHLIDDERIFAYRALCVARREPASLPGFDENEYVAAASFEARSVHELLREYRAVRAATIALFESFTADEWRRKGTVNGYLASVRGLAFHMVGHELHHLRVMRERYLSVDRRRSASLP